MSEEVTSRIIHSLPKIVSERESCRDGRSQPAARPSNGRYGQPCLAKLLPLKFSFFQQIIHAFATLKVAAFNQYGGSTKIHNRTGEGVQILLREARKPR